MGCDCFCPFREREILIQTQPGKREDITSAPTLHTDLAPSFGSLKTPEGRKIDDDMKIMIAGTMKVLAGQTDKSWNAIVATMNQNEFCERDGDPVTKKGSLDKKGTNAFKFDGSPEAPIVKEVKEWFTNFIQDQDVLTTTKIDINALANIVAQTGATVDSFEAFFAKTEVHRKTVVDIGVLRFPDVSHPFFKLFRIQLIAVSDCTRILWMQDDKNSIEGEFNCQKYKPRKDIIQAMTAPARKKAVDKANSYFE